MAEIKEFISPKGEQQVSQLIKSIEEIRKGYAGLDVSMKKASSGFEKIYNKSKMVAKATNVETATRKSNAKALKETERIQRDYLKTQEKLSVAFSDENKKLIKKRAELNKTNKELRDSAKTQLEVERRQKAGIKNAQEFAGAYGKMSNRLRESKALLKDLAAQYGVESEQFKAAKSEFDELNKSVREIDETLGDHQRNVGNYTSVIDQLTARFPILSGSVDEYNKRIKTGESVTSALRGSLGTLGKAIKGIGILSLVAGVVAAAAKFVGLKKEIDANREAVANLTGETGRNADVISSKVSGISKTYNKEFGEVLKTGNAVAEQFGITLPEALDLIADGFAVGADANGEFLEKLKEYPTQFDAAGLSASESIALISQEVKQGIYSDKGVDVIKEATIRLREMTPATAEALDNIGIASDELQKNLRDGSITTFEAIQQVSAKLDELPAQSSEVGTAIADIFGGPGEDAGLNYIKTLKDIETNLDVVKESSNDFQKTQDRIREANESISLSFNRLLGSSNSFFGQVKANALEFIAGFLERSIKLGVDFINFWIDLRNESIVFRGIIEGVRLYFNQFVNAVTFGLNTIIEYLSGMGKLIKAVFTLSFDEVDDIIKDTFVNIRKNAEKFGKDTAQDFSDAYKNTLKAERIDLIDLTSPESEVRAEKAGQKQGESFAKGFAKGRSVDTVDSVGTTTIQTITRTESNEEDPAFAKFKERNIQQQKELTEEIKAEIDARTAYQIAESEREASAQKNIWKRQQAEGKIDQKEYNDLVSGLFTERLQEELEQLEASLEKEINAEDAKESKILQIKKEIAEQKKEIDDLVTENFIENAKKQEEAEKRKQEIINDIKEKAFEGARQILTNFNEEGKRRKQQELDEEFQQETEKADHQISELQRQLDSGIISEEQFALKKDAIEEKLAEKEKQLKIKKFKEDKKRALLQSSIDTALAVLKAIAIFGPPPSPTGIAGIAAAVATGVIQKAVIAAQPIPQFAKGTKSSPEGLALVGEAGREILKFPSGEVSMADAPMITHLPKGTQVFNNRETELIMKTRPAKNEGLKEAISAAVSEQTAELRKEMRANRPKIVTRRRTIEDMTGSHHKSYRNRIRT